MSRRANKETLPRRAILLRASVQGQRRIPTWLFILLLLNVHPAPAVEVNWAAPGDGLWNDPVNWSTGMLPGADDTVVVNTGPTITYDGGDTRIQSLNLVGTLHLNGGTLTVEQYSPINGGLKIEAGAVFVAESAQANLEVNGAFHNFGGSLLARGGAQVSLSGAMHGVTTGLIRAEGPGSRITLNDLSSVGIPLPEPPNLPEAISREASVFRWRLDDPDPLVDLTETVSREASVFRWRLDDPDPLVNLTEAVSREVSVYRGRRDDPNPLADLREAVSREASVRRSEPEPPP